MKKIFLIVVIVTSLFGCATFETAINDLNSALTEMDNSGSEGIYFNPMMEFTIFYATHMMLVGYGFEDNNFKEGEGVTWKVANVNNGEEVIIKRALLQNVDSNSSWWLLSSDADGKDNYYEMLIDNDMNILKVRYRDSETNEIKEIVPEQAEDSSSETEEDYEKMDSDYYGEFSVGKETVKTKAGSFKAEHILIEDDETDQNDFKYEYWLTNKVPGTCIKFIYNDISENSIMTGELIDIRGGFRTELDSY